MVSNPVSGSITRPPFNTRSACFDLSAILIFVLF
jgi:hypothetical protein